MTISTTTARPNEFPDGLAIDLSDVAKTYRGKVHALRGITMQVRAGSVFGLLGPNGAGKSTLVKILMTVIKPTRCNGTLLGRPVGQKDALSRVGYLPEHHRFPDYLTGAQVLDHFGALSGMHRGDRKKRSAELLDLVGMSDWAKKRVRGYSKGMRQRLGIANALIMDPDLVLLDEPTDGVDPVGRRDIRQILLRLKETGHTVFLNSHLLSELEMVCDRVAILVQGLVRSQGTIEELTSDGRRYEIVIAGEATSASQQLCASLPDSANMADIAEGDAPITGSLAGGEKVEVRGNLLTIGTTNAEVLQPMVDSLRRSGNVITSIHAHRPSLEDLFMEAVTDPNTGEVLAPGAAPTGKQSGGAA